MWRHNEEVRHQSWSTGYGHSPRHRLGNLPSSLWGLRRFPSSFQTFGVRILRAHPGSSASVLQKSGILGHRRQARLCRKILIFCVQSPCWCFMLSAGFASFRRTWGACKSVRSRTQWPNTSRRRTLVPEGSCVRRPHKRLLRRFQATRALGSRRDGYRASWAVLSHKDLLTRLGRSCLSFPSAAEA